MANLKQEGYNEVKYFVHYHIEDLSEDRLIDWTTRTSFKLQLVPVRVTLCEGSSLMVETVGQGPV